jgi:hypothetical protein
MSESSDALYCNTAFKHETKTLLTGRAENTVKGAYVITAPTQLGTTYTQSDNKVRELATVCLPWQQWTETSVSFDDVDISAFHSFVVVDLWQSVSEWRLLLSECVFVCRRENVGA